jgi:hypothetical protein
MTAEPKFGNCRDCAAWGWPEGDRSNHRERTCVRSAPTTSESRSGRWPLTVAWAGCFDHIPALPAPPETENG